MISLSRFLAPPPKHFPQKQKRFIKFLMRTNVFALVMAAHFGRPLRTCSNFVYLLWSCLHENSVHCCLARIFWSLSLKGRCHRVLVQINNIKGSCDSVNTVRDRPYKYSEIKIVLSNWIIDHFLQSMQRLEI